MAVTVADTPTTGGKAARIARAIWHEIRLALPPTIFFAIGFYLIVFSMNLIMAQYYIRFGSFMLIIMGALIVGKSVLVADKMSFLCRFDTLPLIYPILFKTFVYWGFVFVARLLEALIHYVVDTGGIAGFGVDLVERFSWNHFAFVQIWVLVLFLIYCTVSELNSLFGYGELGRLLFHRRTTELALNRRGRVRTLVQVDRMTKAFPLSELRDPESAAHQRFSALIVTLTERGPARP